MTLYIVHVLVFVCN